MTVDHRAGVRDTPRTRIYVLPMGVGLSLTPLTVSRDTAANDDAINDSCDKLTLSG